jgi:hypothetical protein
MGNCCSSGEHKHHGKEEPKSRKARSKEKGVEVVASKEEAKERGKENISPALGKGTILDTDKKSENRTYDQNPPPSIPALVVHEKISYDTDHTEPKKNGIEIIPPKLKTNLETEDLGEHRGVEVDLNKPVHPEVVINHPTNETYQRSESESSSDFEVVKKKRKGKIEGEVVHEVEEVKEVLIRPENIERVESEESSPERLDRVEIPVKKEAVRLPDYKPETIVNPSIAVARKDSPKLQTTTYPADQKARNHIYDEKHIEVIAELQTPEVKTVPALPKVDFSKHERETSFDSSEEDRKKRKSWKFLKRPKVLEEEEKQIGFTVPKNEVINEREYSPAVSRTQPEVKRGKGHGLAMESSSSSYSSSDEDVGTIKTVEKFPHMNRRVLRDIQNSPMLKETIVESRVIYPPKSSANSKAVHVRVPENMPQTEKLEITSPRYIKREVSSSNSPSPIRETVSPKPVKVGEYKDTKENIKPEVNSTVQKWAGLKQRKISSSSSSSESDSESSPARTPAEVQIKSRAGPDSKLSNKLVKSHTPTFHSDSSEPKLTQAHRPVPGKVEISSVHNQRGNRIGVGEDSSSYHSD